MNIQRATERWVDAKIITCAQAEQIEQFEQEHASASWVIYGISGLGVLVLLTGLISIVAANWYSISPTTKLFIYFTSLILLGYWAATRASTSGVLRESLLTAFALYILAGIGLISQTYNLEGENSHAIFMWLLITLPVTLCVQSRLLNNLWFVGMIIGFCLWNFEVRWESPTAVRFFVSLAMPYFSLAMGYGLSKLTSSYFCSAARFWAYAIILGPFSLMGSIAWANGTSFAVYGPYYTSRWVLMPICAALLAALTAFLRPIQRSRIVTRAIFVILGSSILLIIPPITQALAPSPIFACACFIVAWAGAAALAAAIPRKRLFDIAAFVIGVRFVVVYFEVFGSLAATGVGLILSGSVILGVAYFWHSYRGRIAVAIQGPK